VSSEGNGKWQMANGKWQMANGKWQMANGKWQIADSRWPIADGKCGKFEVRNSKEIRSSNVEGRCRGSREGREVREGSEMRVIG
jgi:hypothetical protein